MNVFEQNLLDAEPIKVSHHDQFEIRYIHPNIMENFFGYTFNGKVFVRYGLTMRVQSFVIEHEKYHIHDNKHWLGWLGQELRANLACGVRDPLGLLLTIFASISVPRLKTYVALLKSGGKSY
jgi:hypothetical protein